MYFINGCSTISHQASFQKEEWANEMEILAPDSTLVAPNYREFINPGDIRRMSKIIRMGIACSKDCISQSGIENPDAIIVGTGLGCLTDTEKFLNNTLVIEGLIPPTSFIQSTHNTIAGQISLALKNHNYNMTHTQNSLSFEHTLIDGMLCLNESDSTVLVGAADESIPFLDELISKFGLTALENKLSSGASFFMVSNIKESRSKAQLVDCTTIGLNRTTVLELVDSFLESNNLQQTDIDLVLTSTFDTIKPQEITETFLNMECVNVEQYSGYHFTTSAFAMHLATEILNQEHTVLAKNKKAVKRVLLYNNLNNKNIGLTLLQSLEA